MKTVTFFAALLITLSQAFALTPEERQERRHQLREELHRKMRQSMLQDSDPTAVMNDMSRLMDAMMEDSMQDMQDLSQFAPKGSIPGGIHTFGFGATARASISTAWSASEKGRTLQVSAADQSAKLDVQVNGQVISIKTEFSQTAQGSRMAGTSNHTQIVPSDCDGDRVELKAKDNGLELFFPFKTQAAPRPDARQPIGGNPSDIQT